MARSEGAKERHGRSRGRRFEVHENRDGAKYEIRYITRDETFFANPEKGLEFVSEDASEVRAELKEYMRDNIALEWEPIIEIQRPGHWERWEVLGLNYKRKFRAKKVDGSWSYRSWSSNTDEGIPDFEGANWEDCLTGSPGGLSCPDNSTARMKYTPERWKFLRTMTRKVKAIQEAMKEFLSQSEAEIIECLEGRKIFAPIATRLLAAPEEKD